MVRDTSIQAYFDLIESAEVSRKHKDVLLALKKVGADRVAITASELFNQGFKGQNLVFSNVRARLSELRDMGAVEENSKRLCSVTGKTVITWKITGEKPKKVNRVPKAVRLALVKQRINILYSTARIDQKEDIKIIWKMIKEL